MKSTLHRLCAAILCLSLLLCLVPAAAADSAADITAATTVSGSGYDSFAFLTDKNIDSYRSSNGNAVITLKNSAGMAGLYLLFDLEYGVYSVTDNDSGKTITAGSHGMLHEYIDLVSAFGTMPKSVTLSFEKGKVRLSELYVFSKGQLPDFVQVWDAPLDGKADIVLFATHGDDDHLFFAGILPHYASLPDCAVQVVYLTDHRNLTNSRTHEMLNGLWAVGVTAYPVFGSFADFLIEDLQRSYEEYRYTYGTTREELQSFVVEQIRRFRPQVAIGHDINGEYRHGMHMVYTDLLIKALDMTNDPTVFPESAEKWGTWDIPKLYLHLYEKNAITMDWDVPLERLGGMTAFEVSQKLGYPCHKSQQWTWFTRWINGKDSPITKASQIATYNPRNYGLYRSLVGADVAKNDFLENIVTYAEQERIEQERLEQERLEQERLEQERLEQERLEQERLEQERLEQERLEQERLEQERIEQERLEQELQTRQRQLRTAVLFLGALVLALAAVLILAKRKKRRRRRRR